MRAKEINDRVIYIGVNDRTTDRFEGLWPLPLGVSYNSYLVSGSEKVAIIDGVEEGHAMRQIDTIKSILGSRQPDYLVINHMEPDHSGAIRILRQEFPDITIVGNAQTLNMIHGFYGEGCNELAIKDGDCLSLGVGCTLRFYLTPMVHWPETMMTYFEEEKILFSGDAFGCFGALNGAVIDCDMNTAPYMPEMERYYSSIVGKYGSFVQRALKKLSGFELGTICPTHGPVWRRDIQKVIKLYDNLSLYEPLDNGVTIVYGSMYGNTERVAEEAASYLSELGVRDISVFNASKADLSFMLASAFRHRGLIIASPTYSENIFPPVASFVEAIMTRGLKNREIAVIGSHTWANKASQHICRRLEDAGLAAEIPQIVFKHAANEDDMVKCKDMCRSLAERLKCSVKE